MSEALRKCLSPASKRALKEFDEAAQDWGWQKDQGVGNHVTESSNKYDAAKERLVKRIHRLESDRRFLKAFTK